MCAPWHPSGTLVCSRGGGLVSCGRSAAAANGFVVPVESQCSHPWNAFSREGGNEAGGRESGSLPPLAEVEGVGSVSEAQFVPGHDQKVRVLLATDADQTKLLICLYVQFFG